MAISLVHFDTLSVEPLVRRAPNNDIIVVCTCGDVKEPAKGNKVYMFRSKDDGKTFDDGVIINPSDSRAYYSSCFTVIEDTMYIFITAHNGSFVKWENYLLISRDNGYTFMIERLKHFPNYCFVRNMIELSNKDLLFNYHAYPVTKEMENDCLERDVIIAESNIDYVENGVLIGNFKKGFEKHIAYKMMKNEIPVWHNNLWHWNWTENTTIELEKGHLVTLFRIDQSNYLHKYESFDMGLTWTKPVTTDIPNPSTKSYLLKDEKGQILLVHNPNNKPGFYLKRRFPFEVWVSNDNMKSWYKKISISDYPGAYSYPDGFIENGRLKIVYDFNRHDIYFADIEY